MYLNVTLQRRLMESSNNMIQSESCRLYGLFLNECQFVMKIKWSIEANVGRPNCVTGMLQIPALPLNPPSTEL
jgi:hypothetical protein